VTRHVVGAALIALVLGLAAPAAANPVVVLSTTLGDITIELYAAEAPIAVENFLGYVRRGYYEGTLFHRVVPGFIVQGGGVTADLEEKHEGLRSPIKCESANGLLNVAGTVAMARTSAPDSATAQFFINTRDNRALDRDRAVDGVGYAVFGKVTAGMEVVRRIERAPIVVRGRYPNIPAEPVLIQSARILRP
jgi:peptidyl-prolyl cis-trans isomerase A (cyclophilin A)